nr:hypothetical protein [Tanacetum cinerariifolium]
MSASGILSLPEVDGIDEGNGNNEVGGGVYTGNGIRSGGNVYDRRNYTKLEQEQSKLGAPPLPPHLGDTAAGSVFSSARIISSADGRYSGYSGPGM